MRLTRFGAIAPAGAAALVAAVLLADASPLATATTPQETAAAPTTYRVSAQGRIIDANDRSALRSPLGTTRITRTPIGGDVVEFASRVTIESEDGGRSVLPRVVAAEVWPTDVGRIVTLGDHCSNVAPRPLTVLDRDGSVAFSRAVSGVSDPVLSPNGDRFAYRTRAGVIVLDLRSFEETRYPRYDVFTLARDGRLVGADVGSSNVVEVRNGSRLEARFETRERVRALSTVDGAVLVMGPRSLVRYDLEDSTTRVLHVAPDGAELRDLRVERRTILVGERSQQGRFSVGRLVRVGALGMSAPGTSAAIASSSTMIPPQPDMDPVGVGEIPWPLAPNSQQPIGNSYAEFQQYGGSPYMHPGIDVMGAPGQPVYAVAGGEVKAVLTTSGQWHWRVATANTPGSAQSDGYLYAHLELSTIAVSPGDIIVEGQYLGDLVFWPVANFTHTHFARVEDSGVQWQGDWLNVDNPHLDLPRRTESTAPVFLPAIGSDLFAFCRNETSNYRSPDALRGRVDIIARIGDTIATSWVCTVQTIRYSIHPANDPTAPIVDDKLAVEFDMRTDTYANGTYDSFLVDLLFKQDSTCPTDGDYNTREFYHVLTNSDGDEEYEASDVDEAWDTRLVPNGDYVIVVTATDAAGNSTTRSMTVTVANP